MAKSTYDKRRSWGNEETRKMRTVKSGKKYNDLACLHCKNVVYCIDKKRVNPHDNYCHWEENRFERRETTI